MEAEVIRTWMLFISILVFAVTACDKDGGGDPAPADVTDTKLVFDTLPPQDTPPALDLPKGWTMKKDLHKEE
mgnify:CR=1 FL=1